MFELSENFKTTKDDKLNTIAQINELGIFKTNHNEDSKLEESDILNIIDQYKEWDDLRFVYFGSVRIKQASDMPQLISANTRMTLYPRLTEVLLYSRILELIELDDGKGV